MHAPFSYFMTCPKGIESLLADELTYLGATAVKLSLAGVRADGDLAFAYRTCLWSRLANRVLFHIDEAEITSTEALYDWIYAIDWQTHMAPDATLWIDYQGDIPGIQNTQYGAQKVKDALVDALRAQTGLRPTIDKDQPQIRLHAHIHKQRATLSLDLSGDSLHRRGYRIDAGVAPIKENLAAAILIRAGWPAVAKTETTFIDPMCGSATFLIEGAMISADIAPGLMRHYFGFRAWKQHDQALWQALREEALERRTVGLAQDLPDFRGYDGDPRVMAHARHNIARAGLDEHISVTVKDIGHLSRPTHRSQAAGFMVMNPPYGERLSDQAVLGPLYQHLSERLLADFMGWQVAIFTGDSAPCKAMSLRPHKKYALFNGTIPCELLLFHVTTEWVKHLRAKETSERPVERAPLTGGPEMVFNRLEKNLKKLKPFLKTLDSNAYRLYDADMPEYAVAIDCYGDYFHVQEYAPPKTIDPQKAADRLKELILALQRLFDVSRDKIILKQRIKQRGTAQYQPLAKQGKLIEIQEEGAKCIVNLTDYLDTGLFLDHRPVRRLIQRLAKNKRFLNLFAYTATASIHAAIGGAKQTISVDMSATYCDWARRQLALNGFSEPLHEVIQADCLVWLTHHRQEMDLILLDPPTFSNSKRMKESFDIQRDHVHMIELAMRCLSREGTLIFSNNARQFVLDEGLSTQFAIEDITHKSFDPDFERDRKLHHVWLIRHGGV